MRRVSSRSKGRRPLGAPSVTSSPSARTPVGVQSGKGKGVAPTLLRRLAHGRYPLQTGSEGPVWCPSVRPDVGPAPLHMSRGFEERQTGSPGEGLGSRFVGGSREGSSTPVTEVVWSDCVPSVGGCTVLSTWGSGKRFGGGDDRRDPGGEPREVPQKS